MEAEVEQSGEFEAFGTETILLVDDEEYVRELGERILIRAGYTVLTAADGMQARDLFRKKKKQISLVILDLIMPTMGGRQCLEELLKTNSKVKVLIASGLSDTENRRELIEAGAKGFVGKPFRMSELTKTVRQALDSH